MTVYKPKNSRHYHFDFQFKGVRYHGSTGCQAKRDAERYERDQRTEAALGTKVKPSCTLDEGIGLFWQQKGQHEKDASVKGQLSRLVTMIGAKRLLADITQHDLNVFVASRRAMAAKGRETLVSAATVNRSWVESLVALLLARVARAADHLAHHSQGVPPFSPLPMSRSQMPGILCE